MSTQDCDRGEPPMARDAWEYTTCLDGNLDDMGADCWEAYVAVVLDDGRGGQDVRHYLKRRVSR